MVRITLASTLVALVGLSIASPMPQGGLVNGIVGSVLGTGSSSSNGITPDQTFSGPLGGTINSVFQLVNGITCGLLSLGLFGQCQLPAVIACPPNYINKTGKGYCEPNFPYRSCLDGSYTCLAFIGFVSACGTDGVCHYVSASA